jgi:prolyl 4-hydroxylase
MSKDHVGKNPVKGNIHYNYRARIDNLDKINSNHFPEGFQTKILSSKPYIVKLRRFLNTEEINSLLSLADGQFERSTIVVSDEMVESTTRTSETAFIMDNGNYEKYNKPIEKLLKKICYVANCKRNQIEMMLVKYGNGEEYQDHWDFFKPDHTETMAVEGQRIATFFCYLTSLDVKEEGETEFPLVGLKVKPSKGTAVFWWNATPSGKLINKTLHRGNPVLGNTIKYGLNIWIRENGW